MFIRKYEEEGSLVRREDNIKMNLNLGGTAVPSELAACLYGTLFLKFAYVVLLPFNLVYVCADLTLLVSYRLKLSSQLLQLSTCDSDYRILLWSV
jgi:hypothetical protein